MLKVVELPDRKLAADDSWHRRLAIQIAAQLPEKPADALAVLELTKVLVISFLASGGG